MTAAAQATVLGANDRIRVGIIGPGGRGRYLMGEFKEFGAELGSRLRRLHAESGSRPEDRESRARRGTRTTASFSTTNRSMR